MMPLNHILRKCTAGYKLSRSQKKINHLMYMDDIKLFAKNEKELETLIHAVRIYSQDIGMEFGIEKGNLKKETESLLIAAQDNAIRTNRIKARIDKTRQNSKCRLCSDRDETINHIINECSQLAQKEYKARHDWVGKVIHWEMCRYFQFDHTNKWYMHNPAPVLENDLHKLLWDFNIRIT